MAPSAIPVVPETTSELVSAGIKHTVAETAPSIAVDGSHSNLSELDASKLTFIRNLNPRRIPESDSPEVWAQNMYGGSPFPIDETPDPSRLRMKLNIPDSCTDHMITCSWNSTSGWEAPRLEPYGPLTLMPTASVLHYATTCFEGLKMYRGHDLRLRLFRPDRNCRRMLGSALRIALPAFDPAELQRLLEALIRVDGAKWLPKSKPGSFLYLRPTLIANNAALGVQKPTEALLYIIACCFPTLDEPRGTLGPALSPSLSSGNSATPEKKIAGMKLLASQDDTVRAWPGGFGFAKVGANYGPSLVAHGEARARGFDQILWLFGPNCEVTEAGASNFFVVWRTREGKTQLVTAPLGDKVILDGVTRRSILDLAAERLSMESKELQALEIVERKYTMMELEEAIEEGRLIEAFVAGTAVRGMFFFFSS